MAKANKITKEELETTFKVVHGRLWRVVRGGSWRIVENVDNKEGYCLIKFRGKNYFYHRILWILVNGAIKDSTLDIDHIDGDKLNNNISNLRLVSHRVNGQNRCDQRETGRIGYCWHKQAAKWRTRIVVNGKQLSIGYYDDEQMAAEAYQIACDCLDFYVNADSLREQVRFVLNCRKPFGT
jgi:hypothetical protein